MIELDATAAARFADIALGHVANEYPHKLDHVLGGDEDLIPPRGLHPVFHGSFDWHSCVHGWWTLLTVLRLFPDGPQSAQIAALADDTFTPGKIAGELRYLDRPSATGFERPYGWAWLLYLHLESTRHPGCEWGAALEPLARALAERLRRYLRVLTYPIRAGTHFNTAFALVLSIDWARAFDPDLKQEIGARAGEWFGGDRDCQAWEPSGDDFLSPALIEAMCMRAARLANEFAPWFAAFLPRIGMQEPRTLFTPATVSDRSDGKIAHLDGLNLSRAWCWRTLAMSMEGEERATAEDAAERHFTAAMPHLSGDYMGEHWLQSFALLAMLSE